MDSGFCLTSIMLAVEVQHVSLTIQRTPKDCRAIPSYIHRVNMLPVSGDVERHAGDIGLADRVDAAATELGNAFRSRVTLEWRN